MKEKLIRTVLQLATVLLTIIPAALFVLVKSVLSPVGFWQQFVVYGLGVYVLGGLQIIFLLGGIAASIYIWAN